MSEEKELTTEEMEEAIERGVETGVREEIVDIYDDLFQTIWDRIAPTLGLVTTTTIMERAIYRAKEQFEELQYLEVTDQGLVFSQLRGRASDKQRDVLKSGFQELIANLFDILAKLTGNVLVGELEKLVEGKA